MRRFPCILGLVLLALACSGGGGGDGGDVADDVGPGDTAVDALDVTGDTADTADALLEADEIPDVPVDARPYDYPDAAFVHVERGAPMVSAAASYVIDEPVALYRTPDRLPDLGVTALALAGGHVWVGTASGLFVLDPGTDAFVPVALPGGPGPVTAIATQLDPGGRLVVTSPERLEFVDPAGVGGESLEYPGGTLTSVAVDGADVWVGSDTGLRHVDVLFLEPVPETAGLAVRSLAVDDEGVVWLATDLGLKGWNGAGLLTVAASDGALADDDARAVAVEGDTLWVGTAEGLGRRYQGAWTVFRAEPGGLPAASVRALAATPVSVVVAHERGATRFAASLADGSLVVDHYVSQRWLPDDHATAVAHDLDGNVWVGTTGGVARIGYVTHTFDQKENALDALAQADFWRMDGFVGEEIFTNDPWSPSAWTVSDFDNDGLWTQMQVGAWCYAYAVTHDESYYQAARKAMDTMFLEIDVPAGDFEAAGLARGFVARSLVRDDEGALFEAKKVDPRWHLTTYQGRQYCWKDDTSSDEVDGHFFGYPLFYDLCAKDDAERAAVADHAVALARTIAEAGFRLLDVDGEPTYFGHWEPEILAVAADGLQACEKAAKESDDPVEAIKACFDAWGGGGWLNSLQILGTLLAAYHMSGDPYFYDQYEHLIRDHKYDVVATPHDQTATITMPSTMNHSDHELAMLAYHTLIRYEPNDERRLKWIQGLMFFYEHEKIERNPLWAAFVSVLAGAQVADNEAALQSLREIPLDRRDWPVDNTHRKDASPWPNDRHGGLQVDRVFPYDEIKTTWWNTNFHAIQDGGSGQALVGPVAWTLPYWVWRYAGVIGE
jgi:hypothetical protein